jgi:acyl carrier protein
MSEEGSLDLQARVLDFLAGALAVERTTLTTQTSFRYDLGLSSFDALQLVCDVEDHFHCAVPDERVGDLNTVADLIAFLAGHNR